MDAGFCRMLFLASIDTIIWFLSFLNFISFSLLSRVHSFLPLTCHYYIDQWVFWVGWVVFRLHQFPGLFLLGMQNRSCLISLSPRFLVFCCGSFSANLFFALTLCTWFIFFFMIIFILSMDIFKWTAVRLLSHTTIIWFCFSYSTGKSIFQAKFWENSINHILVRGGERRKTTMKSLFKD